MNTKQQNFQDNHISNSSDFICLEFMCLTYQKGFDVFVVCDNTIVDHQKLWKYTVSVIQQRVTTEQTLNINSTQSTIQLDCFLVMPNCRKLNMALADSFH